MSLKAFHFLFIVISFILAVGFGVWCFQQNGSAVAMGIGSLIVAVLLFLYLVWFLKKTKSIRFLSIAVVGGLITQLFHSTSAEACAVCFGNPSSPLTKSANTGILFLLIVIGGVLASFGALFMHWMFKARRLNLTNL